MSDIITFPGRTAKSLSAARRHEREPAPVGASLVAVSARPVFAGAFTLDESVRSSGPDVTNGLGR
jgi:hypothetical protein